MELSMFYKLTSMYFKINGSNSNGLEEHINYIVKVKLRFCHLGISESASSLMFFI